MTMIALREFDPTAEYFELLDGRTDITYKGLPVFFKSMVGDIAIRAAFNYPLEFIVTDAHGVKNYVQTDYGDDALNAGYFGLSFINTVAANGKYDYAEAMQLARDYHLVEYLYVKVKQPT